MYTADAPYLEYSYNLYTTDLEAHSYEFSKHMFHEKVHLNYWISYEISYEIRIFHKKFLYNNNNSYEISMKISIE